MQSNDQPRVVDEGISNAFCRRIMQDALFHRVGGGIHPVHAHQLAALGQLDDIAPPEVPVGLCEVLRNAEHGDRIPGPSGPIVFFREGNGATAIEVDAMLLHPNHEVRCSALAFLRRGISDGWLTQQTADQIEKHSDNVQSADLENWRAAGIELIPLLREDLFLHLAALQQSLAHRFQDGVNTHLRFLMRPSFRSLQLIRPSLYCPTEQRDDLARWFVEFAELPSIDAALSAYYEKCGFVPLCHEYSAARLLRDWLRQNNATGNPCWSEIWDWAKNSNSPIAKYHAISIAICVPEALPDDPELFWTEALKVLDVTEREEPPSEPTWQLYCELASHFARQIESLHPGQHGERVACYAWWLADRLARILGPTDEQAKAMLLRVVHPEAEISFSRWLIARSPVVPSSFRYSTLYLSSVWAMSLLAQLSRPDNQFDPESAPEQTADRVGVVFRGYLFTSPLPDEWEATERIFAYQENATVGELCEKVIPPEEREAFRQVIGFRQQLSNVGELKSHLERPRDASPTEQHLTMLYLKDTVFSTQKADETVGSWLDQTNDIVECLQNLPAHVLEQLLEVLAEFHVRQHADLTVRLPHILAYAIERSNDEQRVKRLFQSSFFMCVSGGVASPIQRILSSKWRSSLIEIARALRENSVQMASLSEPWVAGRIRATFAAITRLIGPRDYDNSSEVDSDQVRDSEHE